MSKIAQLFGGVDHLVITTLADNVVNKYISREKEAPRKITGLFYS